MSKTKSPAALARENERLRAQVDELKAKIANQFRVYGELAGELIDLSLQRGRAGRVWTGVDE